MAPYKLIALALVFQFAFAQIGIVTALQAATKADTTFVFGHFGGGALLFEAPAPGASFVLALQALPLVSLICALSALLCHRRGELLRRHGDSQRHSPTLKP